MTGPQPSALSLQVAERPVSVRPRALIAATAAAAVVLLLNVAMWVLWPVPAGPTVLYAGTPSHVVTTTFDSLRVGTTAIEVDVTARDATPSGPVTVQVQAVLPGMGYATPPVDAVAVADDSYQAVGVPLMMIGRWELHVRIHDATGADDLVLPLVVTG